MRIKVIFLDNVNNINSFDIKKQVELFEGQIGSLYFMFQNEKNIRYIPQGSVITASIDFPSIDDAQKKNIIASQPFADDKSIWKVDIPSSFKPKTGSIIVNIIEDGVTKQISVNQALVVHLLNQGSN